MGKDFEENDLVWYSRPGYILRECSRSVNLNFLTYGLQNHKQKSKIAQKNESVSLNCWKSPCKSHNLARSYTQIFHGEGKFPSDFSETHRTCNWPRSLLKGISQTARRWFLLRRKDLRLPQRPDLTRIYANPALLASSATQPRHQGDLHLAPSSTRVFISLRDEEALRRV